MLAKIRAITDAYRRVAVVLNRVRRSAGKSPLDHKHIFRLMRLPFNVASAHTGRRSIRAHEGSVVAPASLQQLHAWFEDYHAMHPNSGLRMRSPREFIVQQSANQAACQFDAGHSQLISEMTK